MEIEIFTLADFAADYGNGKLIVSGTFDTIFAGKYPAVHPSCAIAIRIRVANSQAGQHDFELRPIGLSTVNPVKGTMDVKLNPNTDHSTLNIIVNLNNLKLEKAGKYSFEFYFDGEFRSGLNLYALNAPGKS
jgi:hypothetical protein